MNKSNSKNIDPPKNRNNKGMTLPSTPAPITEIGGAYGMLSNKTGGQALLHMAKKSKNK